MKVLMIHTVVNYSRNDETFTKKNITNRRRNVWHIESDWILSKHVMYMYMYTEHALWMSTPRTWNSNLKHIGRIQEYITMTHQSCRTRLPYTYDWTAIPAPSTKHKTAINHKMLKQNSETHHRTCYAHHALQNCKHYFKWTSWWTELQGNLNRISFILNSEVSGIYSKRVPKIQKVYRVTMHPRDWNDELDTESRSYLYFAENDNNLFGLQRTGAALKTEATMRL